MSAALLLALALMQHEHHQMTPPPPVEQAAPVDPHAGHQMPPPPAPVDPHAGHSMPPVSPGTVGVAPPPPTDHAAERFYPASDMARARAVLRQEHGGESYWMVLGDQAERRARKGPDASAFEGEGWFGDDFGKWVVKARGEHVDGHGWESAELQALHARPIGPYFDLEAGLRVDLEPKGRTYATLGVEGLAPYWIETKAAAFLSDRGDLSARVEASHDLRLTTRLILQSKVETNLAEDGSDAELGLRLRYEIRREFAPYVGVLRHRTFGEAADLARAVGERTGETSVVFGVRAWF
ncbi:copper resistance protein B [Caulobacter sp. DWR1-3-2b1]|uniref:copper resistance protein B n=1 Tax=Caulobacter sp. DWR1-3-2b1 TaxID=2804670 RepID=UPI003CEAAA3F